MIGKRFAILGALALFGSLLAGVRAEAAYTYATAITINSATSGVIANTATGATVTLGSGTQLQLLNYAIPGSFLPPGPNSTNIGFVGIVPASSTPESFSASYTDVITITNPVGGATGTFTVKGTLSASNVVATGGSFSGTITNQYTPPPALSQGPITIGPNSFSASFGTGAVNDLFGPPTIGTPVSPTGAAGSLGAIITAPAVPEPSSVVMLGLGLIGVAGIGLRRRAA